MNLVEGSESLEVISYIYALPLPITLLLVYGRFAHQMNPTTSQMSPTTSQVQDNGARGLWAKTSETLSQNTPF